MYERGYNARMKGRPVTACPYQRDTHAWVDWVEGWNAADDAYSLMENVFDLG